MIWEYIRKHWQGKFTLGVSLGLNLIVATGLIFLLEWLVSNFFRQNAFLWPIIVLSYFVLFHIIVFIWQAVGVLRVCDSNLKNYINSGWTRASQGVVLVFFASTIIWGITLAQDISKFNSENMEKTIAENALPDYKLSVIESHTIHINGLLSPGITREVKKVIQNLNKLETLKLTSNGGNIFEARGLAKIVQDRQFNTHVSTKCLSSCTLAFIAGQKRTADDKAILGFHQYKLNSKKLYAPHVNIEKEQLKDIQFFIQQGVNEAFLEKAFSTPHNEMWLPDLTQLINAKVIKN